MDSVATIGAGQNMVADPTLRSIEDVIADLSRPVNPRRLKTRKQGGKQITYLPWYQAVKYLDHYAPGWSYEVRSVTTVGDAVAITARISITCAEGIVWREATGYEPLNVKGYGDPTSNAESMALRRAAAKFGLCLYLYGK
ncbi:MAG TPA: Rad52/Rad22 family DNA repair protein [Blastocatellia bacterium]|nr:Rad52/Rad22 family DNA repair protein [Blastocatellia bacterium]